MTLGADNFGKSMVQGFNSNSSDWMYSEPTQLGLETSLSFNGLADDAQSNSCTDTDKLARAASLPACCFPKPVCEHDAAAIKVQKVYKSYRTRRHLADCAVVLEELWWRALDFEALRVSSVSFFNKEKHETAASRWSRALTRVAKLGKGLSKDEKAQQLALQHWLEAIDPRHRYGHNLHLYYDVWFNSESSQPFFYWLDIGDGKGVNLEACPRKKLQRQCIKYLGPKEREAYEVVVENGKLHYKQSGVNVNTCEVSKWIFVLSTMRRLYIGKKVKGRFQHSSFLAGGAIVAAGRLVVHDGVLQAVWPYSGHYLPTEENFKEFLSFLEEHSVNLANVKRYAATEEYPSDSNPMTDTEPAPSAAYEDKPAFKLTRRASQKWCTGVGPRIGCVREYPTELQLRALEQVQYSPKPPFLHYGPIPSPRPSPKLRLSPGVASMGLPAPSPRTPSRALLHQFIYFD